MAAIFGGGGKAAARAAEMSRKSQEVANNRQLAATAEKDARTDATRKVPRGRRLYSTEASQKSNLS